MNLPKVRLDFNFPSQLVFDVSFLELWLEQHLSRDNHNVHSNIFTSSSRFDCTRFQVHCHSKVAHDGHAPIAPSCPQHPSKQLWCLVSGSSLKCRQEKIRQATGLVWCATLEYDSRLDITSVTERYVDEAGNRRSYSRPPYQAIIGMRLKCLPWEPLQTCSSFL